MIFEDKILKERKQAELDGWVYKQLGGRNYKSRRWGDYALAKPLIEARAVADGYDVQDAVNACANYFGV